ncbi:RTPR, ribonucleoside-triphosphate reductase, adenosylcobalamin-dependent [uncultured Caudovirales phage]|uniref:ribonucleoside-triphosphate reductase (thioredoxin) n=1 Tax=uncultured Caudovirales phage TaxID=2100421 RepID=A0A6J5MCJ2_9CAUD|nr:RTPR, ribonucleoside-triphosphate reductase, adenosylcobalamin-dependent [uncultured Caudovirales phage]
MLLSEQFISQYPEAPDHMNQLSSFVFYRTYSRWLPSKNRRETWKETCRRAVEYNVGLAKTHYEKIGLQYDLIQLEEEAQALFHNMFNLKQFLSGRTLWIGGTDSAEKHPLANFNCSFLEIKSWEDLGDLFYLLLVGTGVGFRCSKDMAANLPKVRTDVNMTHSEYNPLPAHERLELTHVDILDNGYAKMYIGDSKEGWVEALRWYFRLLTESVYGNIHTIKISYNSVRQKGERLKTFGGTASGHEPLREMFEGFDKVLKNQLDSSLAPIVDGRVRPIHILDMGNLIGYNVVVGGVRRTAEIFLCDADDWESILAKYGINGVWNMEQHDEIVQKLTEMNVCPAWIHDISTQGDGRFHLNHRRMSNNSIAFEEKPSREMLNLIFTIMQGEGEPGFVNLQEANNRRPNAKGLNPCAEILLDSYGVCNLTTVNVSAFVEDGKLDEQALLEAQILSARAGMRMTLVELELPHWSKVQKRDRLLGCSLTGWKDAVEQLEFDDYDEQCLLEDLGSFARQEANEYAHKLRVPAPLLVTTVKPEGTLSQLAGGVSSGLHYSHSPYYIRRIRINAADPLVNVVRELGWNINAEVGSTMEDARTLVIDFPVASGAKTTKDDVDVETQFETYFMFQQTYTEHNSSNTITVKPNEWEEAESIVWTHWDSFVGVSFLAHDGGTYQLAPYEAITKEQYEEMASKMKPFNHKLLQKYEGESTLDGADACEGGACPIR